MTVTRETFLGLGHRQVAVWYALVALSTAVFVIGCVLRIVKYTQGRRVLPVEIKPRRVGRMVTLVLSHRTIRRRDPLAGLGHALIFYGFALLLLGTTILAFQDDFTRPVLGFTFWHGWFYRLYSLTLDISGVALLAGLALMAAKRSIQRPARYDYSRADRRPPQRGLIVGDWALLFSLFFLTLSGLVLESLRLARYHPSFETWSPVGWAGGAALRALGLSGAAAGSAHLALWWAHGIAALVFVAAIPFTKAVHMVSSPANVTVRDDGGRQLVPLTVDARSEQVGYGKITDFTWQHLVSLDACTRCGKCHEVCPATASGYPLSPRDLILDLRQAADQEFDVRSTLHTGPAPESGDPLVAPEVIWSCMQCMACVEICPVGIEHVPIIVDIRRNLVEQGELDSQLQSTLESIYKHGNSFGEPKRKRPQWTRQLSFEIKDARVEPVDDLWFVGDYASFDPRNQGATRALATILRQADVNFGILFDAEKTGGCDVRRAGEEELWASLADANIELLSRSSFERVFSSDPHTFHTLRNEYPLRGGVWPIVHHSELLLELLKADRLGHVASLGYRVTYHDPCTLGRYNGIYDAPREILQRIGCELIEMPRNRDNSFCCGAGGGRIWMKELKSEGARRPSEQRIDEAVSLPQVEYFVVACPKDVTMYEDAIKTSGHEGRLELRELSELVLEAITAVPAGGAIDPDLAKNA